MAVGVKRSQKEDQRNQHWVQRQWWCWYR